MATKVSSQSELYELLKDEIEAQGGDLKDFNEGSMLDIIVGAFSVGMNEISELTISEFKKTFFETAHGPEVTGSNDDLQTLAVDHFGDRFKRPEANEATGSVDFTRPTSGAGAVNIPAGTVVKTDKNEFGEEIRFQTVSAVSMGALDLTVSAEVIAIIAGSSGNVEIGEIEIIESALTDSSIVVSNPAKMAGGSDAQSDAEYRETIRSLIESLAGATKAAVRGAILAVEGISIVTLIEENRPVIAYDIAGDQIEAGAAFFRIPYPIAYIADENGSSSQTLIDAAEAALETVRACGVQIEIRGATAVPIAWDASFSLNGSGPNFAELSTDPSKIIASMDEYLNNLEIGSDFIRNDANAAILAIWGPSGTNDLTAFNTNAPVANTSVALNEKIISAGSSIDGVC